MAGKRIGEREMKIGGSERDLFHGTIGLKAKLQNWVYNRRFEQCLHLPEKSMERIVANVNDWKPRMLWCYRDGIYALAQYINQRGLRVHSPASVVLGGATVYLFMAEEIERAFRAPVISAYGSREVGAAACECGTGEGHHLATQSHVVEVIDANERPVMEHVDGGFVAIVLTHVAELSYIRKFQVVQEADASITINVVPETPTSLNDHSSELQFLTEKIQVVMGQDCEVRFHAVADIPTTASGKYPYVISRRNAGSPIAGHAPAFSRSVR
jgi:phenylacetate-coenzyme A ligase PaaK-like adenylate-forming protein